VLLLIYHELNKSIDTPVGSQAPNQVAIQVAISNYLIEEEMQKSKVASDESDIIRCYRDRMKQSVNLEQAGNMRAVIDVWRKKNERSRDELMGYVLGTAAFESTDFRTRRESFYYTSAEQIRQALSWTRLFDDTPNEEIERQYVRKPEALAEKVYGGKFGNGLGNGDAWLYRGRGLAFVIGREDYQREGRMLNMPLVDNPDLIFIPSNNAGSFIRNYFADNEIAPLADLVKNKDWTAVRLKVRQIAIRRALSPAEQQVEEANAPEVATKAKSFIMCIANPIAQSQ